MSCNQASQFEGNTDSVELTFGTRQPGEVAAKLTEPQNLSLVSASITPIESLDQTVNFVGINPKPPDRVTESAKTPLPVPVSKVSENVEVTTCTTTSSYKVCDDYREYPSKVKIQ